MAPKNEEKSIVRGGSPRRDAVEVLSAAGLSAIPLYGGPLAALLAGYTGIRQGRRLEAYVAGVEARLFGEIRKVSTAVTDPAVRMMAEVPRTTEQEKLERLRNATVNFLQTNVEDVWAVSLADCVRDVATHEIGLLQLILDMDEERVRGAKEPNDYVAAKDLAERIGLPFGVVMASLRRLERNGLVVDRSASRWDSPPPLGFIEPTDLCGRFLALISDQKPSVT